MAINPLFVDNLTDDEFCRLADDSDPIVASAIKRIERMQEEEGEKVKELRDKFSDAFDKVEEAEALLASIERP